MEKFQNKYRIPSARLQTWDYGNNGSYFITICTKNRECFFGKIVNDKMQLNAIGKLAEQYWMEIPNHFPFIELGNFIVMPNHVHGILNLNKPQSLGMTLPPVLATTVPPLPLVLAPRSVLALPSVETLHCNVSTIVANTVNANTITADTTNGNPTAATNSINHEQMSKISPKPGSISTIIRSYKSVVSNNAHSIQKNFDWQPRFHDHIIRDAESYERIQYYIANNPANWKGDKFNSRIMNITDER